MYKIVSFWLISVIKKNWRGLIRRATPPPPNPENVPTALYELNI